MTIKAISLLMFIILVNLTTFIASASQVTVITNKKSNSQSNYMSGLLALVLSYSKTDYQFDTTSEKLSKAKVLDSLMSGKVSVTWGGTSETMETDYIPVRIDTYRGLMSHRLLLIREGDQNIFNSINSVEDLKSIKFGQGRKWQDTKILLEAGLEVITSNKKNNLYYMLDGSRFDAFPRGANEALADVSAYPDLNLTVEKNLVIIYPLPTYFFISQEYPQLAKDIEFGLESILKNGKFDEYFYNSPEIIKTLEQANLKSRRAIRLINPFLSKETPLERKELWLDFTK